MSAKELRFTEVLLHRPQTQMPLGFFSEPSKEDPKSLSFNPPVDTLSGTSFFHNYFDFWNTNIRTLW